MRGTYASIIIRGWIFKEIHASTLRLKFSHKIIHISLEADFKCDLESCINVYNK